MSLCLALNGEELAIREAVTQSVVAKVAPWKDWCRQVDLEVDASRTKLLARLKGPYYKEFVAQQLRDKLNCQWTHTQRVWLLTDGKFGQEPPGHLIGWLGDFALRLRKDMSELVDHESGRVTRGR